MTNTNSFASKLFVGFVATAMLFTLSYTPAKAATADELQAQIDALLAQIATLQGGSSSSSSSCAQFTMDLTMGASGAEVTALQNFLIGKGHAIAAGATGYFGGQTQAALSAFQSANGISPAAGYFGPVTRAKVNGMCTTSDDSDDEDTDEDSDDEDSSDEELSGEASLNDVTMNDGDDTDLEEGQEDAPIAEMEVEFADGDASISRIDVAFIGSGTEQDPWDTFEDVSLWVDGEEVARMTADDEDEYLDEDDGSLRFTGLDIVAMEDEPLDIVIGVTVQSSVDGVSDGEAWRVDADAIRYFDADDVASTDTTTGDLGDTGVSFDIEEEGGEDEIIVKTATDDPESTTLVVQDNENSDWLTVFAFDLDTDDSTNDITVNELQTALVVSSSTNSTFVNDVQLVVDGETFDDYTTSADAATRAYIFDIDGDLVIDAGERVTVEVQVEFKQLATGNEGVTIYGTASSTHIDAEGADDLAGSQLSGTVTGETHSIRTGGLLVEFDSAAETKTFTADDSGEKDNVKYSVTFDVTALEDDTYLDRTVTRDDATAGGAAGDGFMWATTSDSTTGTTTVAATISAADTDSQDTATQYFIAEGETRTFTLAVTLEAGIDGTAAVKLTAINWTTNSSDTTPDNFHTTGLEDFKTDLETLLII